LWECFTVSVKNSEIDSENALAEKEQLGGAINLGKRQKSFSEVW